MCSLVDWFAFLDSVISFTASVDSVRVWCLCPNQESCVCLRGKSLPRLYSAIVLVLTLTFKKKKIIDIWYFSNHDKDEQINLCDDAVDFT